MRVRSLELAMARQWGVCLTTSRCLCPCATLTRDREADDGADQTQQGALRIVRSPQEGDVKLGTAPGGRR